MLNKFKKFLVGTVLGAIFGILTFTAFPTLAYIQVPNTSVSLANILYSGTAPFVKSGFGNASSAVLAFSNGTGAFEVAVSGTTATSGVLQMPNAANGWVCNSFVESTSASAVTRQTASTASSVTIQNFDTTGATSVFPASSIIHATCAAY